jgi:hypothetical protein
METVETMVTMDDEVAMEEVEVDSDVDTEEDESVGAPLQLNLLIPARSSACSQPSMLSFARKCNHRQIFMTV